MAGEGSYVLEAPDNLRFLVKEMQERDPWISVEKWKQDTRYRWEKHGGLLHINKQIFVPNDPGLRERLLELHYDDPVGGHYGSNKTYAALRRKYCWPNMERQCRDYVQHCDRCQRTTTRRHRPYGQLNKLPEATRPMSELAMDMITGLPPVRLATGEVVDAIIIIVDRFSKYARYFTVSVEHGSEDLAEILAPEFLRYGIPDGLVTDRDPRYVSKFWSSLCYHLRIEQRVSTAFHP